MLRSLIYKRTICYFVYIFALLFPFNISYAQLIYPIVGQYKNKSAQGMAIWGDNAYLMNDGGRCRVYNLKTATVDHEFMLASASSDCHVNNACFGSVFIEDNKIPVIYITEYKGRHRCLVENITNDTISQLMQTIEYTVEHVPVFVLNWCVDTKNHFIYAITNIRKDIKKENGVVNQVLRFRLPDVNESSVVFTEKDVLDRFEISFPNGIQGAKIKREYMFIVTGLQETSKDRFDSERAIIVVDLKKRKIDRKIDLTCVTMNEPEDMDFYKNDILLYCGQTGGIYKVIDK